MLFFHFKFLPFYQEISKKINTSPQKNNKDVKYMLQSNGMTGFITQNNISQLSNNTINIPPQKINRTCFQ